MADVPGDLGLLRKISPAAERSRDILLVVLTLSTGAVDAVTFVRLGKVFSSVITGNLALLGIAAGHREVALAQDAGLALAGYAAGVMLGGLIAGTPEPDQPTWPVRVSYALAVEFGLLVAFSGEWLATGGHPVGASRVALLLLAASAMGMQSSAVRRLGQISTTYLTSTLTALFTGLALRRKPEGWVRSIGILFTAVTGAALGTLAALNAPEWVPAAMLIPIAAVLTGSLSRRPRRRPDLHRGTTMTSDRRPAAILAAQVTGRLRVRGPAGARATALGRAASGARPDPGPAPLTPLTAPTSSLCPHPPKLYRTTML